MTSFEDALKQLELEEEDLKRLISAGEIRAFREGSNMRLDVADVEKVAEQLGIGSPVSEANASAVVEVEELSIDDADDGMVTTQLSEEDTLLDSVVEEVAVEEVEVGAAPAQGGNRSSRSKSGSKTTVLPAVVMTDEGGGMRAALVFTALILVFAIPFAIGMITGHPTGITQGVVDMFAN
ncbi:MAG TPA: hypothetical protein EYN86_05735 [Planctomycetes bacterium]|nr:hypothetical protein [Planctomycetota bacterium]